jgi:hypothetical protein
MGVRGSWRTRWRQWLLLATAAGSALVLGVAAGLALFFSHQPRPTDQAAVLAAGGQTRNASENICAGLPTPSDLGGLGG